MEKFRSLLINNCGIAMANESLTPPPTEGRVLNDVLKLAAAKGSKITFSFDGVQVEVEPYKLTPTTLLQKIEAKQNETS